MSGNSLSIHEKNKPCLYWIGITFQIHVKNKPCLYWIGIAFFL
jgi:hypothetical protein